MVGKQRRKDKPEKVTLYVAKIKPMGAYGRVHAKACHNARECDLIEIRSYAHFKLLAKKGAHLAPCGTCFPWGEPYPEPLTEYRQRAHKEYLEPTKRWREGYCSLIFRTDTREFLYHFKGDGRKDPEWGGIPSRGARYQNQEDAEKVAFDLALNHPEYIGNLCVMEKRFESL